MHRTERRMLVLMRMPMTVRMVMIAMPVTAAESLVVRMRVIVRVRVFVAVRMPGPVFVLVPMPVTMMLIDRHTVNSHFAVAATAG
jgi:hypothetical protein